MNLNTIKFNGFETMENYYRSYNINNNLSKKKYTKK